MRVIETQVFTYSELSDDAKAKARDWYREASQGDNYFSESVIEDAAMIAAMLGIEIKTRSVKLMGGGTRQEPLIYWSGFYSQGDGASFEGTYSYKADCLAAISAHAPQDEKLHAIARALQDNGNGLVATIERYRHARTMQIDVETEDGDVALPETETALIEAFRDFADWIYCQLEKEYEYVNSDEAVAETIIANEYEFTADGKRED